MKKMTITSIVAFTLAAAIFLVPSVYAQATTTTTSSTIHKKPGRHVIAHNTGHEKLVDKTKLLEGQASLLGIPVDDLKARLASGKSFKDIAKDLGISDATLQTKIKAQMDAKIVARKAAMKAKIQQEVTDGKITQAQADKMIANLDDPKKHGFGKGRGYKLGGMMRPISGEWKSATSSTPTSSPQTP